jgi:hypothetical protein
MQRSAKRKMNKKGELVPSVKAKKPCIVVGIGVYSTKAQLISLVKQGNPPYNIISGVGNGFRFYGEVLRADVKKGWWHIQYDLFQVDAKSLRISRGACCTIAAGQDEPQYDPRHDKVDEAIAMLEILESEPDDDCDLALPPDSDDDNAVVNAGKTVAKKKKKKTRKVISIESFLNMSYDSVLETTAFDHYYGECNGDFVWWEILKDGEEIVVDAMEHKNEDESPFSIDIPWTPEPAATDYFSIFFQHFILSLQGKAAILDKYLSNPKCSGHKAYWVNEKVRFHHPNRPDPDFIVSVCFCCVCIFLCMRAFIF